MGFLRHYQIIDGQTFIESVQQEFDRYVLFSVFDGMKAYQPYGIIELFTQKLDKGEIINNENEILTRETIEPYVKEFIKGFDKGIKEFELDIKKNSLLTMPNDFIINRILAKAEPDWIFTTAFNTLDYKERWQTHEFGSICSTCRELNSDKKPYISLNFMFDNGYYCGIKYKALEFVCRNDADLIRIEVDKLFAKPAPKPTFDIKHNLPTIDSTKFDAKWLFDTYNNVVFKCSEECFNAWLKDGIQHPETIEFILKGREGKPAKAQLRKFIETITGDSENTKDAYYKTVFGLEIKTAQINTSTNLNNKFKDLKAKIFELKYKK
jgi:hypothetical protein